MMLKKYLLLIIFGVLSLQVFSQEDQKYQFKRDVKFEFIYKFKLKEGYIDKMRLVVLMPNDIKDRQTIKSIQFSMNPDSLLSDRGNAYAVFHLKNITRDFDIKMVTNLTIYKFIASENTDTAIDFQPYLKEERFIETNSKEIIQTAATLKATTDIETVINTYTYVNEHITYKKKKAIGAEAVLETGEGKCTDFSDLFIALLRVNKIPAKVVRGFVVNPNSENPFHQWAEAYLEKQGWVLFDPTTTHISISKEGKDYKLNQKNKYVILSEKRSDAILNSIDGGHFYYYYWGSAGCNISCKMKWNFINY